MFPKPTNKQVANKFYFSNKTVQNLKMSESKQKKIKDHGDACDLKLKNYDQKIGPCFYTSKQANVLT